MTLTQINQHSTNRINCMAMLLTKFYSRVINQNKIVQVSKLITKIAVMQTTIIKVDTYLTFKILCLFQIKVL